MMRLSMLVPLVGLVSACVFVGACSEGSDPDGEGGAGGEGPGPSGAGDGAGGSDSPSLCPTDGTGTVVIEVVGLPAGIDPAISLDGTSMETNASGSLSLDTGFYLATAGRVYDEDPIVRTVYAGTVSAPSFCLADGATYRLRVSYAPIPSSNKLWLATGKDDELAGFSSADIAETVMTEPTVSIDTPGAGSIAFDKDGNLWAVGPTIGEDMLVRIPAAQLGESGTREPDIKITVPEITAFPYINHIAFDPLGNLWLSASGDQLFRLNAADLTTSGEKVSDVLFTEVINNQGIAFDAAGNLWVAGGPTVERFDASRLDLSDTDPPDLELEVEAALNNTVLGITELAFDKAGNLWGIANSSVVQLAASDLDGSGRERVKANVSFDVDVLALPLTPAFDDGNGLWVSLADGGFGRYAPETLSHSVAAGTPVDPDILIRSEAITSSLPIALFPAPEGLPLYHSLPTE
jgi:hypothetical protein